MLPDFTEAKKKLSAHFMKFVDSRQKEYLGPLAVGVSQMFEGGQTIATVMDDGKKYDSEMETLKGEITISFDEIKSGNTNVVFQKLNEMACQMAQAQREMFYGKMSEVTEAVGNSVSGRPFTAEVFLEALEKIQIEFKDSGEMQELSLIFGPAMIDQATDVLEQLNSNPKYKRMHEELIERKRREFRDREASRKLVG